MGNVNWFGRRGSARQEPAAPMARPATATVRLVNVGGTNHNPPVTVAQAKLAGDALLTRQPFQITAVNGTVTGVSEIFVP